MSTKFEEICAAVLNEIKNFASKSKPIKLNTLCKEFSLTRRQMQKIMFELRKTYPIVAKETEGGGYWIAETEDDIVSYIHMMTNRIKGYTETINLMNAHLLNYGNIPYIN